MTALSLALVDVAGGALVEILSLEAGQADALETFAMGLPEFFASDRVSWAELAFKRLGCATSDKPFRSIVIVSADATYVCQRLRDSHALAVLGVAGRRTKVAHLMAEVRRTAARREHGV